MDFRDYLREQAELHPAMKPQDAMKMIYQASFGAEHLLEDEEAARKYLIQEMEQVPARQVLQAVKNRLHLLYSVSWRTTPVKCRDGLQRFC